MYLVLDGDVHICVAPSSQAPRGPWGSHAPDPAAAVSSSAVDTVLARLPRSFLVGDHWLVRAGSAAVDREFEGNRHPEGKDGHGPGLGEGTMGGAGAGEARRPPVSPPSLPPLDPCVRLVAGPEGVLALAWHRGDECMHAARRSLGSLPSHGDGSWAEGTFDARRAGAGAGSGRHAEMSPFAALARCECGHVVHGAFTDSTLSSSPLSAAPALARASAGLVGRLAACVRDHLWEVTDLGGARDAGTEEGRGPQAPGAPMMVNLGGRDRVLLVAEGTAELRKLIEVELVDAEGDKVTDGGGVDAMGGAGRALRITSRDRTGLLAAMCEAFERAGVAIAEASIETHGDVVRNTFWPTAASAHRLLDAVPVLEASEVIALSPGDAFVWRRYSPSAGGAHTLIDA